MFLLIDTRSVHSYPPGKIPGAVSGGPGSLIDMRALTQFGKREPGVEQAEIVEVRVDQVRSNRVHPPHKIRSSSSAMTRLSSAMVRLMAATKSA